MTAELTLDRQSPSLSRAARPSVSVASDDETPRRPDRAIRTIGGELASRLGAQKYEMWFGNARFSTEQSALVVHTGSAFAAHWMESHYAATLRDVAQRALGPHVSVVFRVDPTNQGDAAQGPQPIEVGTDVAPAEADSPAAGRLRHPAQGLGVRRASSGPSFRRLDSFVIGASNRLAHAAVCRMADGHDGGCASPLLIHGDCGLGKTHLLQGLCARFIDSTHRAAQVRYVTGEQFTNEYIAAVRSNELDKFRRRIRRLDLLAIDDVHFLSNKSRTQKELLHTLDEISLNGARVAMVSDNHPQHLGSFDRGLVSRLLSGLVVRVDQPDRAMRLELVRRLSQNRGLRISEAAIQAIAERCVGSVRELEGGLTRLAALQALMGEPGAEIGLTLVHQAFQEPGPRAGAVVRLSTIMDAVCARLVVAKADVMGSGRHQRVVLARSLVVYLARELTSHSFPEIAQTLGRTNHSTVHTADQRLRIQLEADRRCEIPGEEQIPLRDLVEQLRRQIFRGE